MTPFMSKEHHYGYSERTPYMQIIKSKASLFVHPDKVALVRSRYLTGFNKYSGKRWFRWETDSSRGFYRNANGNIIPFNVTFDGKRVKPIETNPFDIFVSDEYCTMDPGLRMAFARQVTEKLGVACLKDVYPIAGLYDLDDYRQIPNGMHKAFRQQNERDFVTHVFGKSNYRRDLLKASCLSHPKIISIAREFKGLVPVDWIVGFMRNLNQVAIPVPVAGKVNLRKLLLQIDPRSYRSLLQDTDQNLVRYVHDISRDRFAGFDEPVRVRDFAELHDQIFHGTRYYVEPMQNKEIKLLPLASQLDGLVVDDLTFRAAKETNDMIAWGNKMSNCIASYATDAIRGNGIYAAIERDNKVVANLQIKDNALMQLLGRFNQHLNDTDKHKIVDVLNSNGIVTTGSWWGK